jgi:hypothetical protein
MPGTVSRPGKFEEERPKGSSNRNCPCTDAERGGCGALPAWRRGSSKISFSRPRRSAAPCPRSRDPGVASCRRCGRVRGRGHKSRVRSPAPALSRIGRSWYLKVHPEMRAPGFSRQDRPNFRGVLAVHAAAHSLLSFRTGDLACRCSRPDFRPGWFYSQLYPGNFASGIGLDRPYLGLGSRKPLFPWRAMPG